MKIPVITCQSFIKATSKDVNWTVCVLEICEDVHARKSPATTAGSWKSTMLTSKQPRP